MAASSFPSPVGLGAWDSREIGRGGLLRIGETLWSFYSGCDVQFEWKLGAAVSADALDWTRVGDEPLVTPPSTRVSGGGWHGYLDPSAVVRPDGSIELFACAVGGGPGATIVSFTSRDAVDWVGPEVQLRSAGWDGSGIVALGSPWVVTAPGAGSEGMAQPGTQCMFLARSRTMGDGRRESRIVRFDRVAEEGGWSETEVQLADPDGHQVDHPCVLVDPDLGWRLWCSSLRTTAWRIMSARSDDGLTWSPLQPVIVGDPRSPHQTAGVFGPAVVAVPDGLLMVHLASSRMSDGLSVVAFAKRSVDGVVWQPLSERPVFRPRPGLPVRSW